MESDNPLAMPDPQEKTGHKACSQDGFLLIAVLWVCALLALFALSFSSSARVQGLQALNTESMLKESFVLQSGIDWGVHQYRTYAANTSLLAAKKQLEAQAGRPMELKYPRFEGYTTMVGNRTVAVQILDAAGKLNVNRIDDALFRKVLDACGVQMGVRQTTVINSILDWMDEDDLHRQEGAEKDHYMGLKPPYRPKNGPLESIEELLLIKGVDRDLYRGTDEKPGLRDFLTVHGEETAMDINSAAPKAFLMIDELPLQVIDDIVSYRRQNKIQDMTDLVDIVPQGYFGQLKAYFAVLSSPVVEITAAVVKDSGQRGQTMRTTLHLDGS